MSYTYVNEWVDVDESLKRAKATLRDYKINHLDISIQTVEGSYSISVCDLSQVYKVGDRRFSSVVVTQCVTTEELVNSVLAACVIHLRSSSYLMVTLVDKILEIEDRQNWTDEMNDIYNNWFLPMKYSMLYKKWD